MKFLRNLLDKPKHHFEKGGKLKRLYPVYEAIDTFLYTPGEVTKGASHIRDGLDLKRMMVTVAVALTPAIIFCMYNTGYQANVILEKLSPEVLAKQTNWRHDVIQYLGLGFQSAGVLSNVVHGALYFVPVFLVTNIVGGTWEALFSIIRKHEINEGFLVTGLLFPLTLPPTIPLWQVAVGISFGVVIGKEIFGGTGMNVLNPALTARAFLFFAYPAYLSGDTVWRAVDFSALDGMSGATALGSAAIAKMKVGAATFSDAFSGAVPIKGVLVGAGQAISESNFFSELLGMSQGNDFTHTWLPSFVGLISGSLGETSTLACLIGAALLILTGIGSWRIMLSVLVGSFLTVLLFNAFAPYTTNAIFALPFHYHLVLGGYAFGLVFMATDPVSASMTNKGRYLYGLLIGSMVMLVRVINPAYPEGMMLAILFGNVFAPILDYFFLKANINRRRRRSV